MGQGHGGRAFANVMSVIAVFIAMGGTAVAIDGNLHGRNTVGSADIINDDVRSKDIKENTIRKRDILHGAVGGAEIADGAVKSQDIGKNALTGADILESTLRGLDGLQGPPGPRGEQGPAGLSTGPAGGDLAGTYPNPILAPLAVSTGELDDDAITSDKVGPDALTGADINESSLGTVPAAGNANQLDGLDSTDFAAADTVHVNRLELNDDSPNDLFPAPGSGTVIQSSGGTISVTAACYDIYTGNPGGGVNADWIQIIVIGDPGTSIVGVDGDGARFEEDGSGAPIAEAISLFGPDGTTGLRHASFVATSPNGDMLSGQISAELNDDGTDCTVAATGIG